MIWITVISYHFTTTRMLATACYCRSIHDLFFEEPTGSIGLIVEYLSASTTINRFIRFCNAEFALMRALVCAAACSPPTFECFVSLSSPMMMRRMLGVSSKARVPIVLSKTNQLQLLVASLRARFSLWHLDVAL